MRKSFVNFLISTDRKLTSLSSRGKILISRSLCTSTMRPLLVPIASLNDFCWVSVSMLSEELLSVGESCFFSCFQSFASFKVFSSGLVLLTDFLHLGFHVISKEALFIAWSFFVFHST